jgi:predicted deacetylase
MLANSPVDAQPETTLLVSVHDVSPLTLAPCRQAVELAVDAGVPAAAITLMVIPRHEDRVSLEQDAPTCTWLRHLADAGAELVLHGYTHRMLGRSTSPRGIFWAHGFARGQGEFWPCSAEETQRKLDAGREILLRAGFEKATHAFIPPAWLLSSAGREVVRRAGFDYYEEMSGIFHGDGPQGRRLVGWGSLTAFEAQVTSFWSALQIKRRPADTRLAIHPADMARPVVVKAIRQAITRLREGCTPRNYREFLARSG